MPAVKTTVVVSSQRHLGTSARLSILTPIATSAGAEEKLLPVQLCLFPFLSEVEDNMEEQQPSGG